MDNQSSQIFGNRTQQAEKRCSNCGTLLSFGAAFCFACGAQASSPDSTPIPIMPQTEVCGNCGNEIPANAKLCMHCGCQKEAELYMGEESPENAQYSSAAPFKKRVCPKCKSDVYGSVCFLCGSRIEETPSTFYQAPPKQIPPRKCTEHRR